MGAVRVATWNVRGRADPPLDRVAAQLVELDAAVVGLQELQKGQAKHLAERAGYPHRWWTFKHRPSWFLWWRAEGMAVLSRHPITTTSWVELSDDESTSSHRRRIVQRTRVAVPDSNPLWFLNTHLTTATGGTRRDQAKRLAAALPPSDEPGVLVGDLNVDDEPAVLGPLAGAGYRSTPTGPTYPAGAVDRRLDHVLVPSSVEVTTARVPPDGPSWAALSDHLPVVADVQFTG